MRNSGRLWSRKVCEHLPTTRMQRNPVWKPQYINQKRSQSSLHNRDVAWDTVRDKPVTSNPRTQRPHVSNLQVRQVFSIGLPCQTLRRVRSLSSELERNGRTKPVSATNVNIEFKSQCFVILRTPVGVEELILAPYITEIYRGPWGLRKTLRSGEVSWSEGTTRRILTTWLQD